MCRGAEVVINQFVLVCHKMNSVHPGLELLSFELPYL